MTSLMTSQHICQRGDKCLVRTKVHTESPVESVNATVNIVLLYR